MKQDQKVYVVSAARTAIGTFGGSLASATPSKLATHVAREVISRADLAPENIEHVVFGNVITTEPRDFYLSRVAAIETGVPKSSPAMNVNRLCGSGLQALVSGYQSLVLGDASTALVGGSECMSQAPYLSPSIRFGQKMGDSKVVDMLTGTLTDPFGNGHMGVTAENVAAELEIDRQSQDAFAAESHRRAAEAIAAGRFKDQIAPYKVSTRKGEFEFSVDEHVRADTTAESLSGLRPVFKKDGTVTAGNASGINDGAAALVLMTEQALERTGTKPLAEVVGYALAGVDPSLMGLGPVPAVRALCEKLEVSPDAFEIVESNEAFAAQACAVTRELGLDPKRVNPNGGAIALGHPIGATGAVIATKLVYEMSSTNAELGLATMCIGGGQGIAVAFRNAN